MLPGKRKIKSNDLQRTMKQDLRKIMTTTNVRLFYKYWEEYMDKLKAANEIEFITYLKK